MTAATGQRLVCRKRRRRDGFGTGAGPDDFRNACADSIVAGGVLHIGMGFGFDKLGFRHHFRLCTALQRRNPRHQASPCGGGDGGFRNAPVLFVRVGPFARFFVAAVGGGFRTRLSPVAAVALDGAQRLRGLQGAKRALTGQPHEQGIDHHDPDQQVSSDPPQFERGEPGDEQAQRDDRRAKQQRNQFQREAGADGRDAQNGAKNGVAEQTAHAEAVRPVLIRDHGRGIDRQQRNPDRGEDQAADGAVRPLVQGKAQAPGQDDDGDAPASAADDHIHRRGNGGAVAAQPVFRRRVVGGQPGGVIGRVGGGQHHHQHARQDQKQPGQFLAAPFDRRLHVAVEKGISATCLKCHTRLVLIGRDGFAG